MSSTSYCTKPSGELHLIIGPMMSGKCLGRDTPVLMFDGTVNAVQDIIPGELLMGDDSSPRKVLSVCSGKSELFRVSPSFGESYVVNDAHILSLKCSFSPKKTRDTVDPKYQKGKVVNISVKEYLSESKTFKSYYKGYRVGVEFNSKDISLDPYILGVWLGDGTSKAPEITTVDSEILQAIENYAESVGLKVKKKNNDHRAPTYHLTCGKLNGKNPFINDLETLDVRGNKHIPHCYKSNTREIRLKVLAGLLDTDGYYDKNKKKYEITQKRRTLAYDILFIARSLGMTAYCSETQKYCTYKGERRTGTYYRVFISGSCLQDIPCRLKRKQALPHTSRNDLLVGITVESIGYGKYFGFEIDGNNLFVLGDFTVTHNTTELLRRLFNETVAGLRCIYINHEKDTRSEEPFSTHNPLYKKQLSQASGVNLVSTKHIRDVDVKEYDVIGIDEAHFFDETFVSDVIDLVDYENKVVIVSGLNGDMKRKKIGFINDLIPHMDSCTFLTAYCKECARSKVKSNALFSHKFGKGDDVGGTDKYLPLCRDCYLRSS